MGIWYSQGPIAGLDMAPTLEHDRSHSSKKNKSEKDNPGHSQEENINR